MKIINMIILIILFLSSCKKNDNQCLIKNQPAINTSNTCEVHPTPKNWDESIDYSANFDLEPNGNGNLKGQLWFVQSSLIKPNVTGTERRPLLTSNRDALLVFMTDDPVKHLIATITNNKSEKFTVWLKPPHAISHSKNNSMDKRPTVVFSKRSWTYLIPKKFITSEMSIYIVNYNEENVKEFSMNENLISLAPPSEIVTINIAMNIFSKSDSNKNLFIKNHSDSKIIAKSANDLFQKIPVSKLTYVNYEPIIWDKITMPNGETYTENKNLFDENNKAKQIYTEIIKKLVYSGIQSANIGQITTEGNKNPGAHIFKQTIISSTKGLHLNSDNQSAIEKFNYKNNNSFALINYYEQQRPRHYYSSGWGYDTSKNKFISNLNWKEKITSEQLTSKESDNVFKGIYKYLGGSVSSISPIDTKPAYPLYTALSNKLIQEHVAAYAVIDANSPTGYKKWDKLRKKYLTYEPKHPKPDLFGIPIITVVGFYDPTGAMKSYIYPPMFGNWGNYFKPSNIKKFFDAPSLCSFNAHANDGTKLKFTLASDIYSPDSMNKFSINLPRDKTYSKLEIICNNKIMAKRTELLNSSNNASKPIIIGNKK